MSKKNHDNRLIDDSQADEYIMLKWVIALAHEFYSNPENVKTFEVWQAERKIKEAINCSPSQ